MCEHMCAVATELKGRAAELSEDVSHGELSSFPMATLSLSQAHLFLSFHRNWEIFFHTHRYPQTHPLLKSWPGSQAAGLKPRLQPSRVIRVMLILLQAMRAMGPSR